MRIVADKNIPFVSEAFGNLGNLVALPTHLITNATARDADVLIIRNETPVNEDLLRGSRARFVASATAGSDHVDFPYLQARGIGFANAPGANANSVKEYVVAALLAFAARQDKVLSGKTLGVVGVGNIGSKVAKVGKALGMRVLENDPPLARATGDPRFVALDEILDADFITLHTPLTRTGPDATFHLFDRDRFSRVKKGAILVNTSRGAVVDTPALRQALQQGSVAAALIDVWENEPLLDADLLDQTALGTAHVAGYSIEGKLTALCMVREVVCSYLGLSTAWNPAEHLGTPERSRIAPRRHGLRQELALHDIVRQAYDVEQDDALLRKMMSLAPDQREAYYTSLRTGYRSRREFSSYSVELRPEDESLKEALLTLGFICVPANQATPWEGTTTAAGRQA
jgi:erythronate-4-phosphate dehydrogenase